MCINNHVHHILPYRKLATLNSLDQVRPNSKQLQNLVDFGHLQMGHFLINLFLSLKENPNWKTGQVGSILTWTEPIKYQGYSNAIWANLKLHLSTRLYGSCIVLVENKHFPCIFNDYII